MHLSPGVPVFGLYETNEFRVDNESIAKMHSYQNMPGSGAGGHGFVHIHTYDT